MGPNPSDLVERWGMRAIASYIKTYGPVYVPHSLVVGRRKEGRRGTLAWERRRTLALGAVLEGAPTHTHQQHQQKQTNNNTPTHTDRHHTARRGLLHASSAKGSG
jgi:hypothetical protein